MVQKWDWSEQVKLLQLMEAEVDFPPYFYTLAEIGRRGKMDILKRSRIIQALIKRGYRASPTHIDSQAIKTDADLATCIAVARRDRI